MQGMAERAKEAGTQALETADRATSVPMRLAERTPSKVYIVGVAGSILASLGLMLAGRTMAAIFVGLWAPTVLNLALFNKLLKPSHESMAGTARSATAYGAEAATTGQTYGTGGSAATGR